MSPVRQPCVPNPAVGGFFFFFSILRDCQPSSVRFLEKSRTNRHAVQLRSGLEKLPLGTIAHP